MTTAQKTICDLWDEIEARYEVALADVSTERLFADVEAEAEAMLGRKVDVSEVTRALEVREIERRRKARKDGDHG